MAVKIGVFGGTFNPIHVAHVAMAEECARRLALEKLILVPTCIPPHKNAADLADARDRLAMCRLATAHLPLFEVCDFEIQQQGKSYTAKTLAHLRVLYPQGELYLIMGADMFLTVQDWWRPGEIFSMATLCAAQREPGELPRLTAHKAVLEAGGARCVLLDMGPTPLSSTLVRYRLGEGGDLSGLLHPAVLDYVRSRGLYGAAR